MARSKTSSKSDRLVFGFRIIRHTGNIDFEAWYDDQTDCWFMTSFATGGLPMLSETCSMEQFLRALNKAKEHKHAKD